jgi:hypothetical protein
VHVVSARTLPPRLDALPSFIEHRHLVTSARNRMACKPAFAPDRSVGRQYYQSLHFSAVSSVCCKQFSELPILASPLQTLAASSRLGQEISLVSTGPGCYIAHMSLHAFCLSNVGQRNGQTRLMNTVLRDCSAPRVPWHAHAAARRPASFLAGSARYSRSAAKFDCAEYHHDLIMSTPAYDEVANVYMCLNMRINAHHIQHQLNC